MCLAGTKTFAYWGQGNQKDTTGPRAELPLAQACSHYDVMLLGFLANFGGNKDLSSAANQISVSFHALGETQAGIVSCQAANKPVILSIGGAAGEYGFDSAADAQSSAQQIWDLYLGGTSSSRPFGSAVLDGVDLDVENSHGSQYYADFVDKLESLWNGASKKYYLTAAPQCPLPDANVGAVLSSRTSNFDYIQIQFYNNNCGYSSDDTALVASYNQWKGLLPVAKLVPTFPASKDAATSGYADAAAVAQTLKDTSTANFGLFSVAYDQNNAATAGSSPFWSEQVRSLLTSGTPAA